MSGLSARRLVELSLTADGVVTAGQRAAGGAVIALLPSDAPSYAEIMPRAVVRSTGDRHGDAVIEHLRLTPMARLELLPNLASPWPSLVADSVATMFRVGAASVDVVFLRAPRAGRHDYLIPEVREQLLAYLPELWGNLVVFPDLRFAPPRVTVEVFRALAPMAAELFLVFCVDVPDDGDAARVADALSGADVALCEWIGTDQALGAHGWRSSAAVVAGLLSADLTQPGRSLLRRPLPLLPARRAVSGRLAQLTPHRRTRAADEEPDERLVRVEIDAMENTALVRSEQSLRRPAGRWPLPALFCAKFVRRTLLETADRFVFRPVTEQEALALGGALGLAMRPFVQQGLLVGPGRVGAPEVETAVVRDPNAPGLAATVSGYLRPWMLRVSLQVRVANGGRPSVVEV